MPETPIHTLEPPGIPQPQMFLAPEDIPSVKDLVIEDGKPVDNIFSERQMRLLVDSLYASWRRPEEVHSFVALVNVGMFFSVNESPLVPDFLLSLNVRLGDPSRKENNSYFFWVFGKAPETVIEIVSNKEGGEDDLKLHAYARLGIPYYAIFDPLNYLKGGILRIFGLNKGVYEILGTTQLAKVGLSLTLWPGVFQGLDATWLRWCDRDGKVLHTGVELAEQERARAEQEKQRAERLAEQLRQQGIEPIA